MRKINYPLIVSDFDGTLVNADGTITEENKRVIQEYVAAGGHFALSTGRLPSGILSRAKELGLEGKVCCCQGAIIVDIQSKEPVLEGRLSLESTVAACQEMEKMGLHIHAYDTWEYYSNMDDEPLRLYEKLTKTKAIPVTDKPLSTFIREKGLRAHKLLAMVEPKDCDRVLAAMEGANIQGCALTKSAEFLVEVVHAEYSKGTAVEFLANYYGVDIQNTVAIGDQRNDLPMIQAAGVGVAVQNADEGLKAQADYISEFTNEESAVASIIAKYGFCEEE